MQEVCETRIYANELMRVHVKQWLGDAFVVTKKKLKEIRKNVPEKERKEREVVCNVM